MDCDRLIDNYMNGRMSAAEEREFFRRLDVDPILRRAFETERTISGALLRDRSALPPADPGSRVRLLALLAALPAGAGGAGRMAGKFTKTGSAALKGTIATVVAGGISVGIYTAVRFDQSLHDLPTAEQEIIVARPEPLPPPAVVPAPSEHIVPVTAPAVEPSRASSVPVHVVSEDTIVTLFSSASAREPVVLAPEVNPEVLPVAPTVVRAIPSIRSTDSVNLNITIDTGKLNGRAGRAEEVSESASEEN